MSYDLSAERHKEWLGFVQPVGLVVSTLALKKAQVAVNKNIAEIQSVLKGLVGKDGEINDPKDLFTEVLGWQEDDLRNREGENGFGDQFDVNLVEFDEILSPDYVVFDSDSKPLILVRDTESYAFDEVKAGSHWESSLSDKFERLLRENKTPIGVMFNHHELRLFYAPDGESSGHITFTYSSMTEVMGRPILSAFHMLLNENRVFVVKDEARLKTVLADSRKFQNEVSTKLSEQVLTSLYELLRGLQEADDYSQGKLLKEVLAEDPNQVYEGLITVLLRMVFILYAEDRNLISDSEVYSNYYSVAGLFERLRVDHSQHPDTMDSRYGAWAQLLSLFRLIYSGVEASNISLPARHGHLFDPERFQFLEGRKNGDDGTVNVPPISDGCIYRILSKLLILDGERLSYRTLDVEQIGSVYETIMGFNLEISEGKVISLKSRKKHGAPIAINLDELLGCSDRKKWIKDNTEHKLTSAIANSLKEAENIEGLVEALSSKIDKNATPSIVPKGKMIFQPSNERRKSGSHYTPRELTAPIVGTALRPLFERLGSEPRPSEILEIKICDPAMGSGAFLVEATRQLGDALVRAWHYHKCLPEMLSGEDEVLFARRVVAQRCIYGVDKNPMAVDLAKLSLWLITLAENHSFTFLDHALKHGDSLVGMGSSQIASFSFEPKELSSNFPYIEEKLNEAEAVRGEIQKDPDSHNYNSLLDLKEEYFEKIRPIKLVGDLLAFCIFNGRNSRQRKSIVGLHELAISNLFAAGADSKLIQYCLDVLESAQDEIVPFHWDIEFPEVFRREKSGFDSFIGNPPFISGLKISERIGDEYNIYLASVYPGGSKKSDISSYFVRRCFNLINYTGTIGLICTNTISQGDTKRAGIDYVFEHEGLLYNASKDILWPGEASVFVNFLHISKDSEIQHLLLNGKKVEYISPFLTDSNDDDFEPKSLIQQKNIGFVGVFPYGTEFLITIEKGQEFLETQKNSNVVYPCIGGSEFNKFCGSGKFNRYIINFGEMGIDEAKEYPIVFNYLESILKEKRLAMNEEKYPRLVNQWWKFWHGRQKLFSEISEKSPVFLWARARTTNHHMVSKISSSWVPLESMIVFVNKSYSFFSIIQSTIHELWLRRYSSTLKTDIRYVVGDCFETFPIPDGHEMSRELNRVGEAYFEFRESLMKRNSIGLTALYNRFHNPDDVSDEICQLRELHKDLDTHVLRFYGFTNFEPDYEFVLDYESDDEVAKKKKKPWRLSFSQESRRHLFERLIKLNKEKYLFRPGKSN